METLRRIWSQFRTYWSGLGLVVRTLIIAAVAIAAAGIGTFVVLNQSGDSVQLFAEKLPEQEVETITTLLESKGIKHTLKDSQTIKVPKDQAARARVVLAAEGLPSRGSGKGWEIIDNSGLTTTPFIQNVNYIRALQGELARSLMQIDSVASARVIIARPDPSPFALRDQRPTKASVVLKLKPGAIFNHDRAANVVQLVSRSVDGLMPEHVTVIDSTGRQLSDPNMGDKDDLSSGMIDKRRELEAYLAQKAQTMLTAHLGPGRAVVQVSADLNYQKVKKQETLYPKDGTVPRSERTETRKSSGSTKGGVSGAGSNVKPAGGPAAGGGGTTSEETQQTDYDTSRVVKEMEEKMGAVTRLTVAAFVDLTPPPAADGQPAPKTISVADAEAIIQNAIGFQTGRDSVKVVNERLGDLPPTVGDPDEETLQIQRMTAYVELARNVSLAVSVLMAAGVLSLLLVRRRPKPAAGTAAGAGVGAAATGTGDSPAATPATPEQRREDLLNRFIETTRTDPARSAAVFGLLLGPSGG